MSDYRITFAPELHLSAADFVDSWKSIEQCRGLAETKTETAEQSHYDFGAGILVFLGGIGVSVATTAINELVKQAIAAYFKKRQQADTPAPEPERIEVREIEQPDGSKLIVVVLK